MLLKVSLISCFTILLFLLIYVIKYNYTRTNEYKEQIETLHQENSHNNDLVQAYIKNNKLNLKFSNKDLSLLKIHGLSSESDTIKIGKKSLKNVSGILIISENGCSRCIHDILMNLEKLKKENGLNVMVVSSSKYGLWNIRRYAKQFSDSFNFYYIVGSFDLADFREPVILKIGPDYKIQDLFLINGLFVDSMKDQLKDFFLIDVKN